MANPGGIEMVPTLISPQLSVTAGTPTRISETNLYVYSVNFIGKFDNAGRIFIGDSSDNALFTNEYGVALPADGSWKIDFQHHRGIAARFNLKNLWFDGDTTGDKLIVWYTK
jgi:hypothetical protein